MATLVLVALVVTACQQSPPSAAVSSAVAPSGPTCDGFAGRIHGASACVRYDRGTRTVARIRDRVMPGEAHGSVECNQDVQLETLRVKLSCDEQRSATLTDKRAVVAVVITDATRRGERVILDQREGFWDFINVWVLEADRHLDFTIDYGVLD